MKRLSLTQRFWIIWLTPAVIDIGLSGYCIYKGWQVPEFWDHPSLLLPITFFPLVLIYDIKPVKWFFRYHPYDEDDTLPID